MNLVEKCAAIRLLLADVDGVLTDGRLIFDNQGVESKEFHIRDGQGIRLWQQSGGRFGIVTGRNSQIVKMRAVELGVDLVRQGVDNKWPAVQAICDELNLTPAEVCYVGDDLLDLATVEQVGMGVSVADAAEEVRQAADYTTSVGGGCGALREVVELLLKNTNRWETVLRKYKS
jgi:YrbI family 3-deoxy-D-manno-octulosonate 8-phosphate phosphatase